MLDKDKDPQGRRNPLRRPFLFKNDRLDQIITDYAKSDDIVFGPKKNKKNPKIF